MGSGWEGWSDREPASLPQERRKEGTCGGRREKRGQGVRYSAKGEEASRLKCSGVIGEQEDSKPRRTAGGTEGR